MQRFLEGPADSHCLADRLHLDAEFGVGIGEFLECKSRPLGYAVVDGRLETGWGLLGDIVVDLVERKANRQQRGYLGDGKARRFRGKSRTSRDPRIHFYYVKFAIVRVYGELDIRSAGFYPDRPDDLKRCIAHKLVFFVGQRLGWGDGDAVAGMYAHRVEILDRADDNDVVLAVAHDLKLVFLPADDRFLNEDLRDRALVEAPVDVVVIFLHIVGDVSAHAA